MHNNAGILIVESLIKKLYWFSTKNKINLKIFIFLLYNSILNLKRNYKPKVH